jgi:hypothetical protein
VTGYQHDIAAFLEYDVLRNLDPVCGRPPPCKNISVVLI